MIERQQEITVEVGACAEQPAHESANILFALRPDGLCCHGETRTEPKRSGKSFSFTLVDGWHDSNTSSFDKHSILKVRPLYGEMIKG